MAGKYLYSNLKEKLEDPRNIEGFVKLVPEMFITLVYTCLHAFLLFLEYNIYIVVINSSMSNFIIFIFVINLTKMKGVMKKTDEKGYQQLLNLDSKEKITENTIPCFVSIFTV